jgi:hypothetical protein
MSTLARRKGVLKILVVLVAGLPTTIVCVLSVGSRSGWLSSLCCVHGTLVTGCVMQLLLTAGVSYV